MSDHARSLAAGKALAVIDHQSVAKNMPEELARDSVLDSVALASRLAPLCASLSRRQGAVLELAARGLRYKQIAHHLRLTEATVKKHMQMSQAKLGGVSRSRAVAAWLMFCCRRNNDHAAPMNGAAVQV